MTEGWDALSLGDLAVFRAGGSFPKRAQGNESGDLPFIKVGDLSLPTNGHSIRTARNWVSYAVAEKLKAKAFPPGSAVFAKIGEGLKSERVRLLGQETLLDNNLMGAIPKADTCEEKFLFYLLQTVGLASVAGGSALPYLRQSDLEKIPVRVPPLEEQRRVAGVLGALDDLAERAADLAQRCDAMLQASWEERERSCTQSRVFSDLCSVKKGVSYKGKFLASAGTPMLNLANFGRDGMFKPDGMKYYTGEIKQDRMLDRGALVVANTDLTQACDILGRPAIVPEAGSTSTHHTFQVNVPGGEAQRMWIYATLRHPDVRRSLVAHATGTTVTALPQRSLGSLAVPWPGDDAVTKWWAEVKPLFTAQSELIDEAEQCRTTRDELLPLLLSGRVRVGEVAA